MPVLVTSDWHLSELPKDQYRFGAIEFFAQLIEERGIDQHIILGDLTHNKNYHPDTLVNDVVEVLHALSSLCPIDILQGNHDYVEAATPFFHFVRLLKDVSWIRLPTIKHIPGIGKCCFLPHTRDYRKAWIGVKSQWHDVDMIFAHNAFEGAVGDNGYKLEGIPLDIFPAGVQIISGDVHSPQSIGDNFMYAGAPYTQKYGDDYVPRVLIIADGTIESVEVPGPQKRLYDIFNLKQLQDLPFPYYADMVKVRYHLSAKERGRWPEIKEEIKAFLGSGIIACAGGIRAKGFSSPT